MIISGAKIIEIQMISSLCKAYEQRKSICEDYCKPGRKQMRRTLAPSRELELTGAM